MRERLSGGYVGEVWRDGATVTKTYAVDGLAPAEAAGLRWLTVPGGPRVPTVTASAERSLTMEFVETGRPTRESAETFGAALGRLHLLAAPAWGFSPSGHSFIGSVPVEVGEHPSYASFWQARVDLFTGLLGCGPMTLPVEIPDDGPRRVHGDLWSGNLLWGRSDDGSDGAAYLIDPAAHGGHPELDVAMLTLFGAPHLETLVSAWAEVTAPADGWRERLPLHQVPHLLFHASAFGGSYLEQARRITSRRRPP